MHSGGNLFSRERKTNFINLLNSGIGAIVVLIAMLVCGGAATAASDPATRAD